MTDREIRREVERAFYEYKERKAHINSSITEVAESGLGLCYDKLSGGSGGSADNRIIAAMDRAHDEELWCRVVELTRARFAQDIEATAIISRYFRGYRKNKRYRMLMICSDIYISEATFYNLLKKILNFATQVALQFGLICVVDV